MPPRQQSERQISPCEPVSKQMPEPCPPTQPHQHHQQQQQQHSSTQRPRAPPPPASPPPELPQTSTTNCQQMKTALRPTGEDTSDGSGGGQSEIPRRQEWAKLTDRTLSPEERKRIAKTAAQRLFAESRNQKKVPGQALLQAKRPQANITHSLSMKTTRPPAPPRRASNVGKEVSKDFLTLACYNAVATGQLGLLKALQRTGKTPQVDKLGNTPLHVAAKSGQLRSLK